MRRRNIPPSLCSAALRLQRCPVVTLNVRDTSTGLVERTRGALTGNSLAPLFGRILVEDVFIGAHCLTDPLSYRFLGTVIHPMAWSDNLVVFGSSVRQTAKCLSILAEHLESKFLRVKEHSGEIVPASSRKLLWHSVKYGPHAFAVVAESRVLGYHLSCNGDTSRNRCAMIGSLRGVLHRMSKNFARVLAASRAFWWKTQFRGTVNFHAAFVGCSKPVFQEIGVVANLGARKVGNLPRRHNNDLTALKSHFNLCVQSFFARCVVRFMVTLSGTPLISFVYYLACLFPAGLHRSAFMVGLGSRLSQLSRCISFGVRGQSGHVFR